MFLTTKALVLREVKYKEADKILTLLTAGEGKLTVKARGALRRSCKYGAAAQALTYSEMTLFGNRGKWSLNEAVILEQFLPLRADLEALSLGAGPVFLPPSASPGRLVSPWPAPPPCTADSPSGLRSPGTGPKAFVPCHALPPIKLCGFSILWQAGKHAGKS